MEYKAHGYSLTEIDRKIIRRTSERHGLGNESAALRLIIRQWLELTGQKVDDEQEHDETPETVIGTA